MVIEWIDNNAKRKYIKNYITALNKKKPHGKYLRPVDMFAYKSFSHTEGFETLLHEMEYDNIYVRFFTSSAFEGQKQVLVNDCLVFCFGDFACPVHTFSYQNANLDDLPAKMLEDIQNSSYMYDYRDFEPDEHYIKQFILPNMMPQQKAQYVTELRNLKPAKTKQTKDLEK